MSWISWLNGVIWNICHSSNCIRQPTVRCPSSVFFGNRFRSADCQKIQLPLGGSRGEEAIRFYHIIQPLSSVTFGRILSAPTRAYLLKFHYWIKMFEFGSGCIRAKLPIHSLLGCVSSGMPCGQTFIKVFNVWNTYIQQALSRKRR